ncbi:MAG: hypothetical protein ACJZ8C_00165 [Prochlorococcus marinus subsp. pastoris]
MITLQKRFFLVSFLFLINSFLGLNFSSFVAANNKENLYEFEISTHYLDNLPKNDYILVPGHQTISKASVLTDAIDIAGGVKPLIGPLTFIKYNDEGTSDKRNFLFRKNFKRNSYKYPLLKEGELIDVGESLLANTKEIVSEVTPHINGLFSLYGLYKAIND